MNTPALCIDLGASFTKLAIRISPNEPSILLRDQNLMVGRGEEDKPFCFPSIAAHNTKTGAWAFGWEAADYRESEEILILQDWKSVLFHEKYLEEFYDPELDGEVDPVQIFLEKRDPYFIALGCARHYLKWLYEEHIPYLMGQVPELAGLSMFEIETRVCVPDFVLETGAGKTIERLMEEAGFETPDTYCISEPKSSLIGVITEGRNRLTDEGKINNAAVFGDHQLLDRLTNQNHSVFFIDIGAFTTDMALARFSQFRSHYLAKSPAASFPLGMYRLDSMILNSLPDEISDQVNLNNLPDTERFHRTVYHENRLSRFTRNRTVSLDSGVEIPLSVVDDCLDQFTDGILIKCSAFLRKYKTGEIQSVVLTGGGSLPSRISDRMVQGLEKLKLPLLRSHKGISAKKIPVDPIARELVRGASAIGGSSILYTVNYDASEWEEEKVSTDEVVRNLFGSISGK